MKDLVTIGLPSKGRLKEKSISFFNDSGLKIIQSEKERNYFGTIENKPNIKIIFLHAKEIIQRLGDGTLDLGVSGLDLLNESDKNLLNPPIPVNIDKIHLLFNKVKVILNGTWIGITNDPINLYKSLDNIIKDMPLIASKQCAYIPTPIPSAALKPSFLP